MTTRRRILWASSLTPWLVAALVWGVVQLASTPDRPGTADPAAGPRGAGDRTESHDPSSSQARADDTDWAAVLDRLDRRRARAYALNDPTRLRAVYVPGSRVLRHDLAVLRAYRERGVRLTGVRLRAIDVRLVGRNGRSVRLRVVDRLDRPEAHTARDVVSLPRDRPTERVIVLRKRAGDWRIAAVRPG